MKLSATSLLELSEQKRVARVDLADAGYDGIYYVCDLTAAQQQQFMSPRGGTKMRQYKDGSFDMDLSSIPTDASPKLLMACLVTDSEDGAVLERAFEATQEPFIVLAKSELVWLADEWKREMREPQIRERLEQLPNAVSSLLIKAMRQISGLAEDAVLEKKEN